MHIHSISPTTLSIVGEADRSPQSAQLSSDMESLFISTLLKQMRQSMGGDGLFPGDQSDTLGGIFDMYLSKFIAETGGIGLADSLGSMTDM